MLALILPVAKEFSFFTNIVFNIHLWVYEVVFEMFFEVYDINNLDLVTKPSKTGLFCWSH